MRGLRLLRIVGGRRLGRPFTAAQTAVNNLYRRAVVAKFGAAISLRDVIKVAQVEGLDRERIIRRVARLLRSEFRNEREAAIGPDLAPADTDWCDDARATRAGSDCSGGACQNLPVPKVERRAEAIGREIAADYSYLVVRLGEQLLGRLWNRIYDGVAVRGGDRLQALAKTTRWSMCPAIAATSTTCCFLYVVYRAGLTVPHIAAGANLNLPLVGGILRRGGAFSFGVRSRVMSCTPRSSPPMCMKCCAAAFRWSISLRADAHVPGACCLPKPD